ncbi:elicitor-responsive protein 3-like [Oryza glaberrima]|uniref:elicitor-responsive protein 3-like n=1 Tax=Oryza glaberrima TaxID=4538 RepID=UPI00224C33CB|nr:elicitor-responsive protein 3-like [Oryza glaberrima]
MCAGAREAAREKADGHPCHAPPPSSSCGGETERRGGAPRTPASEASSQPRISLRAASHEPPSEIRISAPAYHRSGNEAACSGAARQGGRREEEGEEEEEMVHGTLEVLLVEAKGLENTDYLCNMDPYAVLKCRSQEQRSSIASGKGSNPEWNENFVFTVSDKATELLIKLLDSDTGSADDFVGEATIPLEAVYTEGSIPPTLYNVVKDEHYCGEIKVGLTFTPEDVRQRGLPEDFGGWKQSR